MKIFGKRIGVTKTKNIKNTNYRPKAEILKKLEENLVKTVKVYSDYAKKVHRDDSLKETTDVLDNKAIIDIQVKIFMKQQQLIQSLKNRELFEAIEKELYKFLENLDTSLNFKKIKEISKYQDEIDKNLKNIENNLEKYGEHLRKFEKNKGRMANNYRDKFTENAEFLINKINIYKYNIVNNISNIKDIIKKSKNKETITNIINITSDILEYIKEFTFEKYDTEYDKYSKNNKNSFRDECISKLQEEYGCINNKLATFNMKIDTLNKYIEFLQNSKDYEEEISKILRKYRNCKYKADDVKNKLRTTCGKAGETIIENINDNINKIGQEKEQELKKKEQEFLGQFENDEIKGLAQSKIKEEEAKKIDIESESEISKKIIALNQDLIIAKKNLKEKQEKEKNSYLGKLLNHNKANGLLNIDNMSKSNFKDYCQEISSNQSELIEKAKNTQKVAKKAKQIIKDIYDLENKILKLNKSKDKSENQEEIGKINGKIAELTGNYNQEIQKLLKFSTNIEGLKIVDVDKLEL